MEYESFSEIEISYLLSMHIFVQFTWYISHQLIINITFTDITYI